MRSFLNRLTKVHPTPEEPSSSNSNQEHTPALNSAHLPQRLPALSKQFSLQTQSFSPRPILKQSRKSYRNSKHKSLRSDSERESFSEKDDVQRRKTMKSSRVYPEASKRPSEELDPSIRRSQKKKEKLAELNSFEVKFNGAKLADKIRKRSMKRSNTLIITADQHSKRIFHHHSPNILQRPSDGVLIHRPESEKIDFPFFHDQKTFNEPGVSSVNFMDGVDQPHNLTKAHPSKDHNEAGASTNHHNRDQTNPQLISNPKKGRTRKQRTNYRLRFDEKYKNLKYIIFPDDPFRTKWDLLILG